MVNSPGETIESRDVKLSSPLGDSRLSLIELSGSEHVNDLGLFRLRVVSPDSPLSKSEVDKLIGGQIQIDITFDGTAERTFTQTCFGLRDLGRNAVGSIYELELRPWIWIMSRRQTSRIFHNQTINKIIEEVIKDYRGVEGARLDDKIGSSIPKPEYTVQYQETDLNFIRRLMEEYGINFHIEMRDKAQHLVLTNLNDDLAQSTARHRSFQPGENAGGLEEVFNTWIAQRHLTTTSVRMTDYDFVHSATALEVNVRGKDGYNDVALESYEHPGRYNKEGDGKTLAKRRIQALRGADEQTKASGYAPTLGAGMKFTLDDDGGAGVEGQYCVIAASHHYLDSEFRSGGAGSLGYHGEYTLVPADLAIAPDRVTPRPYLRGPQSAEVSVGADGAVDEFGRIKVRFPWDKKAESMFCRVSQLWAGEGWGGQFIPRAGMEVLVDFMEGDPDRPVIVGCLYNDKNKHPFPLPGSKTQSGIKTRSSSGKGHNTLRFEDLSGKEEIFIHAEKDMKLEIKNDESVDIKGEAKRTVKGKETITVQDALKIESYKSIELKVGSSSIKIEPAKITVSSPEIMIDAMGQLTAKGLAVKVAGSAEVAVSGALVRIN